MKCYECEKDETCLGCEVCLYWGGGLVCVSCVVDDLPCQFIPDPKKVVKEFEDD